MDGSHTISPSSSHSRAIENQLSLDVPTLRNTYRWLLFGDDQAGTNTLMRMLKTIERLKSHSMPAMTAVHGTQVQIGVILVLQRIVPFSSFSYTLLQDIAILHDQRLKDGDTPSTNTLQSLKTALSSTELPNRLSEMMLVVSPSYVPRLASHLIHAINLLESGLADDAYVPKLSDWRRFSEEDKEALESMDLTPIGLASTHIFAIHQPRRSHRQWLRATDLSLVSAIAITFPIDRFETLNSDNEAIEPFGGIHLDLDIIIPEMSASGLLIFFFTGMDVLAEKLKHVSFSQHHPASAGQIEDEQDPRQVYSWISSQFLTNGHVANARARTPIHPAIIPLNLHNPSHLHDLDNFILACGGMIDHLAREALAPQNPPPCRQVNPPALPMTN